MYLNNAILKLVQTLMMLGAVLGVRRFWRITYIMTFGSQPDYEFLTHSVSWY